MNKVSIDPTNGVCGALFIAFGAFFAYQSFFEMDLGTTFKMGPGYFPLVLAAMLIILGAIILVEATRVEGEPIGDIAWRGMMFILPAPVFFGLTVRGLGFVPSIFVTTLIAAFASTRMGVLPALLLSVGVTIFSVAVFSYALGLPFQRFGPWLPF